MLATWTRSSRAARSPKRAYRRSSRCTRGQRASAVPGSGWRRCGGAAAVWVAMGTDLQVTSGERRIARRRGLGRFRGTLPPLGRWHSRAGSAAVEQLVDDVDQRPPAVARLGADALERLAVADPVALHEDALGPLDPRAAVEGVQQLRELAVALEGDVDRALQLGLVRRVDVGEHAALGGGVDEVAAGVAGERGCRAGRPVDDLGDDP